MKICSRCGKELQKEMIVCPDCGSEELTETNAEETEKETTINEETEKEANTNKDITNDATANEMQGDFSEQINEQPSELQSVGEPSAEPIYNTVPQATGIVLGSENRGSGNVVMGMIGAILFSLIGGLLYFIIYQVGVIAGICGLIIFVLANIGYALFAKSEKNTVAGLIVSAVITLIVIFLSEYTSLSFTIYSEFKDLTDISFFDALSATPKFLKMPEIREAVVKDLVFAYGMGIATIIAYTVSAIKGKKRR